MTNQSALTSLRNTKGQIHLPVPGGSAIRDCDEKSPGLCLFLCSACSASGGSSRIPVLSMPTVKRRHFPSSGFLKNPKASTGMGGEQESNSVPRFWSSTFPLCCPAGAEACSPWPAGEAPHSCLARRSRIGGVSQREKHYLMVVKLRLPPSSSLTTTLSCYFC